MARDVKRYQRCENQARKLFKRVIMEFERKFTKVLIGFFIAAGIHGIISYSALLFGWTKLVAFIYIISTI